MSKIANIIKYEGDNNTFVWKHPDEDFNNMTQLIVHESQEAIFFMNGQALDLFGPGRHTLETQNIPIIGGLLNRVTGDQTPFHCEVYFINQTVQMGMKWGTDSKVRYIDPESGILLELGASGEMTLRVCDSRKLLIKLVGTTNGIAWNDESCRFTKSLQNLFRPLISTKVKSNLTTAIKERNINILEIDEHIAELSETLKNIIIPGFEEYGLTIPNFYLTNVVLPEDDPDFKRIRELHTIALKKRMINAEADIRVAKAEADAKAGRASARTESELVAARRQTEFEKQTTETEIARREAERKLIEAQAEALVMKTTGFAEAEIMQAKGYNQKDIIQADVQKAFAEGLGSIVGGSSSGGLATDMVGMMAGIKMAGTMMGQIDGIMDGLGTAQSTVQNSGTGERKCVKCGNILIEGSKFCLNCGEPVAPKIPDGMQICPNCRKTVPKGKFCFECGCKLVKVCPNCGRDLPDDAKFCFDCGTKVD